MTDQVPLDGESLTPEDVAAVARDGAPVTVPDSARERVRESRERVRAVAAGDEAVYGLNTGFGDLVDTRIDRDDLDDLQHNLIRSHAAGAGDPLPDEAVRAMLATRVNALVKGYSGVREAVVDALVALLNEGVTPVVPQYGSLGASGDLAPLAHASLALLGEGRARVDGEVLPGDEALDRAGVDPVDLAPKEGLALINGTQLTVGLAALVVVDAEAVLTAADVAGGLTTEVTMSTTANCDPAIQGVRPHVGQAASARNVRRVTAGSEVIESHRNCDRVQDAYAIRCLPQLHGAVRDAVSHLRAAVEVELNSATDNPLVFPAGSTEGPASGGDHADVISGGNFHGAPLAHRLDYAVAALTDLATIAERRVDRTLNPAIQEEYLPPFLAGDSGLESGLMIAQYTAAALVNECRALGRTATDNTPVSGNQEDHVSMSAGAAEAARTAVEHAANVVGIELLCGAEAAEHLSADLALGTGTGEARDAVREVVDALDGDRVLADDLATVGDLVREGVVTERVAEAVDGDLA